MGIVLPNTTIYWGSLVEEVLLRGLMLSTAFEVPRWITHTEGQPTRLLTGLVLTLLFTLLARRMRGVSVSGAVAGFVVIFILYVLAGPQAFAVLVCVFLLTWLATRFDYGKKKRLGTAEQSGGRTASQVIANLGVATIAVLFFAVQKNSIYLLAAISALAEAAADTVSSEYGQARGGNPRLITTRTVVPPGTDGALSVAGTLAGVIAALIVSSVSALVGLISMRGVAVTSMAAIFGMFCDSILGASLERKRWLNNNAVNFLSTLMAAIFAVLLVATFL
jgi:uncharacterized protein (TIGR00297 family)